jgi:hypothetical protein
MAGRPAAFKFVREMGGGDLPIGPDAVYIMRHNEAGMNLLRAPFE